MRTVESINRKGMGKEKRRTIFGINLISDRITSENLYNREKNRTDSKIYFLLYLFVEIYSKYDERRIYSLQICFIILLYINIEKNRR